MAIPPHPIRLIRTICPKCPACGFSIFNRRFAKCESCDAQLPGSITYTTAELAVLCEKDGVDEEHRQKALQQGRKAKKLGNGDGGDGSSLNDIDIDFSD